MKKTLITFTAIAAALIFAAPLTAQTEDSKTAENTQTEAQEIVPAPLSAYPDFTAFMDMYNISTFSSHSKLTLMHKSNNLAKLGKETVQGKLSGTLSYKTSLSGFSGVVTMQYINYCDFPGWVLNGFTNTKANIWANGEMFGTVEVSGKYSAKICYDNIEIKDGKAGGGYYTVEYPDGRKGTVAWDAVKRLPEIKK